MCSVCAGVALSLSPGTALLDSVHLYSFNSSGREYKMGRELQFSASGPFSGGAVCGCMYTIVTVCCLVLPLAGGGYCVFVIVFLSVL